MAPLKAPGSDRFHALFFQSQWDILGNDVCQWVKSVFDVTFDPLAYVMFFYKLVMKVIVNRFKEQAGFIAGRNIFYNIILAQEVIHSMRCNRKGRKWMLFLRLPCKFFGMACLRRSLNRIEKYDRDVLFCPIFLCFA
ncbi:Retrovirus-related Pol polyprotein LINE-1 [Gossypium australe]|uniref:Retrovirus-related Pol polyprotein LINE-1 n=1 Tax=Gossypium australe TaxID=47621 RepID=A0A5B6WVC2_9ROSI|nr:Retrovirus-related Pol polyprotein LINE-1 [Gossypium australe]